jgi:hypothetical protein
MGHYSKECPNLLALATKENMGSSIRRFFAKEKGKTQLHSIEPMNERQKKTLMGLEKNFKIPMNVIDVMAQTKRLVEDTIHLSASVKRFKEMVRTLKEKNKIESGGLDSKTFQILEILVLIPW